MSQNDKKVAIVQIPSAILDLAEGVRRAELAIREAAENGASLVVFPESWLTGYPAWVFDLAIWDDAEARYWHGKFLEQCPTINCDSLLPIRQAAADCHVNVLLGLNERARPHAGSIYNSTLLIGTKGETLNVHRKLTPTHTERIAWAQGDASGLKVTQTTSGRVGSLICWEHWHPLMRQTMHFQDEQIHIACWPDMADSHIVSVKHYAFEGRCFVVSAAQYLRADDVPEALRAAYRKGLGATGPVLEDENLFFNGGSAVVGPNGEWVVEPLFDQPGILYANIDIDEANQYKHDLDVVGHYSRSDVFQLSVNRTEREIVAWKDDESTSLLAK
ncbi:carbon-nitrogen hydrolase family protein [Alteromonas sp. C1M14]|uniref:carbon-nitrogen hydrolase family protein n=1 Tax=Alteromonas sp. C1M14 TaxID=2841567 RepID=UPI001C084C33|nr:carbon-nitrogen hydrolase family protein [Alteromonas sp. C1M14]MBU2979902.1 carbon-nitrogen hydrolase family protein [Alteromonas sp. C1M14]